MSFQLTDFAVARLEHIRRSQAGRLVGDYDRNPSRQQLHRMGSVAWERAADC